jgi:hypothetical protein
LGLHREEQQKIVGRDYRALFARISRDCQPRSAIPLCFCVSIPIRPEASFMIRKEIGNTLRNSKGSSVYKALLLAGLFLAFSLSARAQGVQLFGGYSYIHYDGSPSASLNGWELSAQYKFLHVLGAVADLDAHYGSPSGTHEKPVNFFVGPQISFPARISPFVHAMFGISHINEGGTGDTSFGTALGGGIDVGVLPLVSWRVFQADDVVTRFFGQTQHNVRISTGIVFNF